MISIKGKTYAARTVEGFETYNGYQAKVVSGVNTKSGEAVAIHVDGNWLFINQSVR